MSMKIFFQKLRTEKLEKDAELSEIKATEWQKLVKKSKHVVRVGRKYSSKAVDEDEIF